MASAAAARLLELLECAQRLALVGLAKNTGKTETLAAILDAHAQARTPVGVTSIGRDGERRDVIDERIAKPAVRLRAGALVASTAPLLRASGLAYEQLTRTALRTPLGEVVIARMSQEGAVEVAGPSAAADVRAVTDAMLELGARQVLIDGAVDRRAASSPAVADGLVMATGAVLGRDIEQVAAATADALEVAMLPLAGDAADAVAIGRDLALGADPAQVAALLADHPRAPAFTVEGALSAGLLDSLLAALRGRAEQELRVIAADPTHVFLAQRAPSWYRRQGLSIEVLRTIELKALTVNPVAPQSHSLDSGELRRAIAAIAGAIPVVDVRQDG